VRARRWEARLLLAREGHGVPMIIVKRTTVIRVVVLLAALCCSMFGAHASASATPDSRVVHFPKRRSLGNLKICDWGAAERRWEDFCEARGDVTVPSGKEIGLFVEEPGERLWRIAIGEGGLGLHISDCPPPNLSALAKLGENDLPALGIVCDGLRVRDLRYVARLRGLRELKLGGHERVGDAAIVYIEGLPNLRKLSAPKQNLGIKIGTLTLPVSTAVSADQQ